MNSFPYTIQFTPWPVTDEYKVFYTAPEPGAHPAEYLQPGVLRIAHTRISDPTHELYLVPPIFTPDHDADFVGYLHSPDADQWAPDIEFKYFARGGELMIRARSRLHWDDPAVSRFALASIDAQLNLHWEQRDENPRRRDYTEAVIGALHKSMRHPARTIADGQCVAVRSPNGEVSSYHLREGNDIIRVINITEYSNSQTRNAKAGYYGRVLSYFEEETALAWHAAEQDARCWPYGMNPLFDTPLTGSDIPEWHVQPILRHLPDSSIRRQRVG